MGWLLLGCGAIALLLSASGIYASLRTCVAARARELAIRAALGAGPAVLSRLALGHAALLCLGGAFVSVPVMALLDRVAGPATFGLVAFRTGTLAASIALVLLSALLAAWGPTRRALGQNVRRLLASV